MYFSSGYWSCKKSVFNVWRFCSLRTFYCCFPTKDCHCTGQCTWFDTLMHVHRTGHKIACWEVNDYPNHYNVKTSHSFSTQESKLYIVYGDMLLWPPKMRKLKNIEKQPLPCWSWPEGNNSTLRGTPHFIRLLCLCFYFEGYICK